MFLITDYGLRMILASGPFSITSKERYIKAEILEIVSCIQIGEGFFGIIVNANLIFRQKASGCRTVKCLITNAVINNMGHFLPKL